MDWCIPTENEKSHLDVIRCHVTLHVAILLFGRGRGGLVGRWEVGPVKRVKKQHDIQHSEGLPRFRSPPPSPSTALYNEKSCLHLPLERSRVGGFVATAAIPAFA